MDSIFRKFFAPKAPPAAATPGVEELYAQATAAYQAKDFSRAIPLYERVIALQPDHAEAYYKRGNALKDLGQLAAALTSYDAAIERKPDFQYAWCNRGAVQQGLGQHEAALNSFDQAVKLNPDDSIARANRAALIQGMSEAHANRGIELRNQERWEEALAAYDRALALRPDYVDCLLNRSSLLRAQLLWDAALASCERAIALQPDYAEGHFERASILAELARYTEALAEYDRAIAIRPDFAEAQYNRALLLLLTGDYESGWASYEWRWRNMDKLSSALARRTFTQPLWLGKETLAGKRLLIYCEQGYGDALQFCRYAKTAADMGATVLIEAPPPLKRLLETLDGVTQVIAAGGELPEFDYRCPVMSLPAAFKASLDNIPRATPYLHSDPDKVAAWHARLGERRRPRIGLVWSGNPAQPNDRNRSFRLARLVDHLPRELDYVCLQKDIRPVDEATLAANPWISRHDRELRDFTDTAALCECLDLVISVCTSAAHLGGALGRPMWVLLTFNADWRWLTGTDVSPWYPTAKLYRQRTNGDWNEMFARVATDLRQSFPAVG